MIIKSKYITIVIVVAGIVAAGVIYFNPSKIPTGDSPTTSDSFPCANKSYVSGELIVSFNPGVTISQVQDLVDRLGASMNEQIGNPVGSVFLINVKNDQENEFIQKFQQSSLVKHAELNGCAYIN